MGFENAILDYSGQPISRQLLQYLLKDYRQPADKISELVKQGILLPVKRGIFVPGPSLRMPGPEPFLLANHLCGPSYVSLESALAFRGLIPEQVFETASVTTAAPRVYETAAGRFSYTRLPLPYYSFGQERVELAENQAAIVATAEKALCDKIVTTSGLLFRSPGSIRAWLTEDMRMGRDALLKFDTSLISGWIADAPKQTSLQNLVKTLDNL